MAETICITTRWVGGERYGYYFHVSVDATVECLREMISSRREIPMTRLIISYAGVELEDGQLLSKCGILGDSTVEIADVLTIKLTLQEFGGGMRARTVDVSPQMELGELRYIAGQVVDTYGIGLLGLALAVGSIRCTDMENTLTDHRIVDGSVVTIVCLALGPVKS